MEVTGFVCRAALVSFHKLHGGAGEVAGARGGVGAVTVPWERTSRGVEDDRRAGEGGRKRQGRARRFCFRLVQPQVCTPGEPEFVGKTRGGSLCVEGGRRSWEATCIQSQGLEPEGLQSSLLPGRGCLRAARNKAGRVSFVLEWQLPRGGQAGVSGSVPNPNPGGHRLANPREPSTPPATAQGAEVSSTSFEGPQHLACLPCRSLAFIPGTANRSMARGLGLGPAGTEALPSFPDRSAPACLLAIATQEACRPINQARGDEEKGG